MKLYHATNESSVKLMFQDGIIGVTIEKYIEIAFSIEKDIGLQSGSLNPVVEHVRIYDKEADYSGSFIAGSVSFFPLFDQAKNICHIYSAMGGEFKGGFIRNCVKRAARLEKRKLTYYQDILDKYNKVYGGSLRDSVDVIIEVDVPSKLIVNPSSRGEIYTKSAVPYNYIVNVHKI